jgi:oligopeptide/dipeptide ABC transporter ATP-binding protein
MEELQEKFGTALLLITHDLGVIAEKAHRVIVMYAGKIVETSNVDALFARPQHPYTSGLLASIPRIDSTAGDERRPRLNEIKGGVPSLLNLPAGCTFAPRCPFASNQCRAEYPPLEEKEPDHWAACWHSDRVQEMPHE